MGLAPEPAIGLEALGVYGIVTVLVTIKSLALLLLALLPWCAVPVVDLFTVFMLPSAEEDEAPIVFAGLVLANFSSPALLIAVAAAAVVSTAVTLLLVEAEAAVVGH